MSAERAAATPCKGCGALVFFVRTVNGRFLPVDVEANDAGNCAVRRDANGNFLGRTLTKEHPEATRGERLFMPHMATCPKLRKSPPRQPTAPRATNVIPISRGREVELPI